ncbi:hypothetical protein THAOC_20166, partial [Thalassiosira oceanica]
MSQRISFTTTGQDRRDHQTDSPLTGNIPFTTTGRDHPRQDGPLTGKMPIHDHRPGPSIAQDGPLTGKMPIHDHRPGPSIAQDGPLTGKMPIHDHRPGPSIAQDGPLTGKRPNSTTRRGKDRGVRQRDITRKPKGTVAWFLLGHDETTTIQSRLPCNVPAALVPLVQSLAAPQGAKGRNHPTAGERTEA